MCSPSPSPVPPPSQETFERVFTLQRRVEPDHENHITSSFSILDINNNETLALGNISNLEITKPRRSKKSLGKNTTAQSDSVYEGNMTCLYLAGTGNNLDHNNLALSPTTPQENYLLARDSIAILSDSRVKNQQPDNSSNPSNPKPPSSIYSHSLLQPIYVPVIRGPETRWSYHQQENRHPKGGTWHESEGVGEKSFYYQQ